MLYLFTDLASRYFIHFRREDYIDTEVKASGFVRQVEKEIDFLTEIDIEYKEKDDDDTKTNDGNKEETYEDCVDNNKIELGLDQLNELMDGLDVSPRKTLLNNDNEHLKEIPTVLCSDKQDNTKTNDCNKEETYEDCVTNIKFESTLGVRKLHNFRPIKFFKYMFLPEETLLNNCNCKHLMKISTVLRSDKQDNTENERERNNENVTKNEANEERNDCISHGLSSNTKDEAVYVYDDTRSVQSISTAATIAPDVIKRRTKMALYKEKIRERNKTKRALVKGEASAVTRVRRDNRATIKESTGIWGWE